VLSYVIIPWRIIVIQKREEISLVFDKSLPEGDGGIIGE